MDIKDLINHALEQKPVEFADTFNSLIVDKLQTAVANKKSEIAQSLLGDKSEEENNQEEEEENA